MNSNMLVHQAVTAAAFIKQKWLPIAIASALVFFVVANGRLVYLAFEFKGECVTHQKQGTSGVTAAKSSC